MPLLAQLAYEVSRRVPRCTILYNMHVPWWCADEKREAGELLKNPIPRNFRHGVVVLAICRGDGYLSGARDVWRRFSFREQHFGSFTWPLIDASNRAARRREFGREVVRARARGSAGLNNIDQHYFRRLPKPATLASSRWLARGQPPLSLVVPSGSV